MSGRASAGTWKAILGLCDEAEELRSRVPEGAELPPPSVRAEIRRRRNELRLLLEKEARHGALAEALGEAKLSVDEAEVIAILLQRVVDPQSPWLTGREILDRIAEDSFTKLRAIGLLAADATLRTSGLVTIERANRPADPLDVRFRLSDSALALFFESAPRPAERKPPRRPKPYRSNREYLLDLRDLTELCRRRAHALFGPPDNDGRRPSRAERKQLDKRIRIIGSRLEQDLLATPDRAKFPMVAFQVELSLTAEESLAVVDLLFAELFEGEPSLEIVELLQLVSRSEEDLLRRRRMFTPDAALVRHGIVVFEENDDEHDTTGRVSLARWVVDRILGEETSGRAIAPDERIDFHLYLKDLDSSARFYRDLAGGESSDGEGGADSSS